MERHEFLKEFCVWLELAGKKRPVQKTKREYEVYGHSFGKILTSIFHILSSYKTIPEENADSPTEHSSFPLPLV